jgi:hypothetical protein
MIGRGLAVTVRAETKSETFHVAVHPKGREALLVASYGLCLLHDLFCVLHCSRAFLFGGWQQAATLYAALY